VVPRRIDWLHLTVFILALVGILAGLTASLALLVVTAIDVSMGDSANALGIAWATASVASTSLLGLPMAYWTGRKLFRGQAPERSRPAPKWAALALLFPPAIAAGYLASVDKVEAVDPLTVKVTYKEPYGPALATWTFGIIPKHLFAGKDLSTTDANQAPIGTGPTCQKTRLTVTSALLYTPTTNSTMKKKKTIR